MTLEDSVQAYFDDIYNKLHSDHVRAEVLTLHNIALAEKLNAHLGLEPLVNPTVQQIQQEAQQTPQQPQ